MCRDFAGNESFRNHHARLKLLADHIGKAAVCVRVEADAEHRANLLRQPQTKELVPELRNLFLAVVHVKRALCAEYGKSFHLFNLVIHSRISLQFNRYRKGILAFEQCAEPPRVGRRNPVEAGERLGEALRRIVAVLQREVDNLCVARDQLVCRLREPARADVLAHAQAGQRRERPLQIEAREAHMPRRLRAVRFLQQVLFNILQRAVQAFNQFQLRQSFRCSAARKRRSFPCGLIVSNRAPVCPVFSCHDLSGQDEASLIINVALFIRRFRIRTPSARVPAGRLPCPRS
jgi:hypothetical protein